MEPQEPPGGPQLCRTLSTWRSRWAGPVLRSAGRRVSTREGRGPPAQDCGCEGCRVSPLPALPGPGTHDPPGEPRVHPVARWEGLPGALAHW